jgi:alkaline phosphatase
LTTAQDVSDPIRQLQFSAIESGTAAWGHWGGKPKVYSHWTSHSNRLIPVYTFGVTLDGIDGESSVYRDPEKLKKVYGFLPTETVNPTADYFDQCQLHELQQQAAAAGKKYIFLVIFDGMDWQTTHLAATVRLGREAYSSGRGTGLHFLDYKSPVMDFGYMVTSPATDRYALDVDSQTAQNDDDRAGGFDARLGGSTPWAQDVVAEYLMGTYRQQLHVVTDSASSATSMTSGIKTYNASINVDVHAKHVSPVARDVQAELGFAVGVVTSVPISHATPAAAYANNVSRDDYQDLTRDLVGLPSVAHRNAPLPGVDVLIGAGWGDDKDAEERQGKNYVSGNRFLTADDLRAIDWHNGGKYEIAIRTAGKSGVEILNTCVANAIANDRRLVGFFGVPTGHLPYQTADGRYDPTRGAKTAERYTKEELAENPTLAQMTSAAIQVLVNSDDRFWLMVEAGDVDWANHENNIDDSIGAVFSGDDAVKAITDWIDANQAWEHSALIVTADHGHYFNLLDPSALIPSTSQNSTQK